MLLMIDNYDSFTYNLVQYLGELGADVRVYRNDQITVDEIAHLAPDHIVISPGPCTPNEAGISVATIKAFAGKIPLLGVCLGHQSIGQAFGGRIIHARQIMHGKTSMIHHNNVGVFQGLSNPFEATRYHSLVIEKETLPDCLEITAWTETPGGEMDEIMGVRHKEYAIEGVQFHPESILTEHGHALLKNFWKLSAEVSRQMDMPSAIRAVTERRDLTSTEMTDVMNTIMSGGATPAQIGGFLIGLRMKGETVDEIAAAAQVMRELAVKVEISGPHLVDTCGTGGDTAHTFNISTASAFVAAAAGARVAKHGNRSVSSKSGSADVLEAAGVRLDLTPHEVACCVNEVGVGFMFAPAHHGAMKHAIGPRREMGVRTLFNVLGPLTNPAGAPNQVIGVFDDAWLVPLAQVLARLGSEHVLVVHSEDGMDEISIGAATKVAELKEGKVSTYSVTPEQFGMQRAAIDALKVSDAQHSLAMIRTALDNTPGPARDIVALNAGAAIYAAGLAETLELGVRKACDVIASGAARAKLEALIKFTNSFV